MKSNSFSIRVREVWQRICYLGFLIEIDLMEFNFIRFCYMEFIFLLDTKFSMFHVPYHILVDTSLEFPKVLDWLPAFS